MKRLIILCLMTIICTACSASTESDKPIEVNQKTPSALNVQLNSQDNMENWKVTVTPTSISNEIKLKIEVIKVGKNQVFDPSMSVGGIAVSTSGMEQFDSGFSVSDFIFPKDSKELEVKLSWTQNNQVRNGKSVFEISATE